MYAILDFFHRKLCDNGYRLLDTRWKNTTSSEALPHVTECSQHVELSFIPPLLLTILIPLVLYDIRKSPRVKAKVTSPITIRIVLTVVLLVLQLAMIVGAAVQHASDKSGVQWKTIIISDIIQFYGLVVAFVLTIACRQTGVVASGVLYAYWILLVVLGFSEFRYSISQVSGAVPMRFGFNAYVYIPFYLIVIVNLVLSSLKDELVSKLYTKTSCPEYRQSFINQITFQWFTPLAVLGNKKPLERSDLWDLNDKDASQTLIPDFDKNFLPPLQAFLRGRRKHSNIPVTDTSYPSVIWAIFKTYPYTFLAGAMYKLIFDLLQFVAPQLLNQLITFMQKTGEPVYVGVGIAMAMFLVAVFQSMILHQYFHGMFRLGMNIRTVLTAAVYRKAMSLSNNARKNRTIGEIVNLMSIDIQRFQDMTNFVMLFWSAPLQVILSIFFLWRLLGMAVAAGLVILIALLPFNSFISVKMRNRQVEQMKYKDERLKMMSEILNGMKVLKLYAWEKSMQQQILEIRQKEIMVLKKIAYLNALTSLSWSCAPFLVAVLTFGVYVKLDPENNVLTPQITFVALALFNILRFPLAIFSMIFSQAIQCVVSNKRLKAFFAEEEMDETAVQYNTKSEEESVNITSGTFAWENASEPTVKDINLSVKKGELVAIVGRVGAGKSSLLSAMLGEMTKIAGKVNIAGSRCYVPQQPWIQNLSLRENILFNRPMDDEFYHKVVDACALNQDLASLPAGDATEIGEKGINLSGGQKQRVSLARAVYSGNDLVILDDPLSAVDAHVGKHIFEHVISSETGILKGKTRIFVTHGVHFLKYCDKVIVMKDGTISEIGSYHELIAKQGPFSEFIEEFLVEEVAKRGRSVSFGENEDDVNEILSELEKVSPEQKQRIETQLSNHPDEEENVEAPQKIATTRRSSHISTSRSHPPAEDVEQGNGVPFNKNDEKAPLIGSAIPASSNGVPKPSGKTIEKENMETGKVKWTVYASYVAAIGITIALLFFAVYVFSSILGVASNLWLAKWSDDAQRIQSEEGGTDETNRRLIIYALLGVGQALTVCSASVIMAFGMVRASKILHEGILSTTLRAPMSFLDVTPIGRIINRFGKDIEVLDARLPSVFMNLIGKVVEGCMIIFVPCYTTPSLIIVVIILIFLYLFLLRFYVSTSRQLKRLESTTRSPIFSHFQESVQGSSSIRAYNMIDKFMDESARRVDENMTTYYPGIVANRWLAVRLEMVGNLIVLFAALFAALFRDSPGLSAGLVGLSVSYALNITQTLNWAVRMTSELETNIVAVERINEYAEQPTEGLKNETEPKDKSWPAKGEIHFRDYKMRYRPGLDLVLKGVTADISSGQKIGIVGRTGAGKSSLTLALFRICEADSGYIEIDGERIDKISLDTLRSRLTIVPQDPILFSGTLRLNLDPFRRYSDEAVWNAIREAHLESFVSSLPDGISHKISEGGENLSVGQRQLICLARALLRKTKILVLDEAAAAVDMETDALIQKAIREQFKECTVLTIAHRLNTVMDSDVLFVLDDGKIVEKDSPQALLALPNGVFKAMAVDAGISQAAH